MDYTVDGKDQFTDDSTMTAREMLIRAGKDPATHQIIRPDGSAYRDDDLVSILNCDRFTTSFKDTLF